MSDPSAATQRAKAEASVAGTGRLICPTGCFVNYLSSPICKNISIPA
jgi:hypothetical protein